MPRGADEPSGRAIADKALGKLLDRIERLPPTERSVRRVMERLPAVSLLHGPRQALMARLKQAEAAGAVTLEFGRGGNSHNVERVVLVEDAPLYALLGRTPRSCQVDTASTSLRHHFPEPGAELGAFLTEIEAAWLRGRKPYGFGVDDPEIVGFLRALKAVLRRSDGDTRDMRTFSSQETGNSKLVENHRHQIARYLRDHGHVPSEMEDDKILSAIGLEKFPPPVLMAGAVRFGEARIRSLPCVSIPVDALEAMEPDGPTRSVLGIENLASFHRHVREAREDGDVVIFTGGYPSRGTLRALRTAYSWAPGRSFHWGDIDPDGVGIALYVRRATGVDLRPHLMDVDAAKRYGVPAAPGKKRCDAVGTRLAEISAFLDSDEARRVEQEEIDPAPIYCLPEQA